MKIRTLNLARAERESAAIREAMEASFELDWKHVASETELLDQLNAGEWDLVICNCDRDGALGVDVWESIEESGADIPFIVIAEKFDERVAIEAMRAGVSDYLAHEDLRRLVTTVTRELRQAASRREKRVAEKALAESEDRLRLALQAAGIGAWEVDLATDDMVWSPEASAILGIPVAGSKSSTIREMIAPEDLERVDAATESAIEAGRSFNNRIRVLRRDGSVRWVAVSGKCEHDERGKPVKLVGTIRDVTKEKDAEDALIEAEERYRVMAETAADGVVSIDPESRILFVNPAIEGMFGYTSEELLGQPVTILMADAQAECHLSGLSKYIESGRRSVDWRRLEVPGRRKDGSEIFLHLSFGEYRKNGTHIFTGFVRDITEAKAQADALRRSEHNFRALVQATTEYVWMLDERANLTELPQWWVDLTGQSYEASLRYGWVRCVHPDDRERVKTLYVGALDSGKPISLELRIRTRDGEYRHFAANGVPTPGKDGGNRWICTLTDITAQRETEERYKIVSSMSADYMFSAKLSEDGRPTINWVAGALETITGRREEFFVDRGTWRSIVHEADLSAHDSDLEVLLQGRPTDSELRILRPDGEIAWVRRLARPVRDPESGRVVEVVGAVADITKRKLAEEAVREREEYLSAVLNAEPHCVKVLSPSGEILDMNPAGLAIIEADRLEDVVGRQPFHLITEDDVAPFKEAIERAVSGEAVTISFRLTGLKGTPRVMEMTTAPVREQDGKVVSVLSVSRDITETHRIQAALAESERQYSDLIHTVEGIVWEVDIETMAFTFVSQQAESILGYPLERWKEKDFWVEHIYPDDRDFAVNFCAAETAKGDGHVFEYRMLAADGRTVWLRDIVSVVSEQGVPKKLRGLMVDVTEQRRMDAAVKQQALLIEQSNEAIFVWDFDGGIIEWNLGCEKLFGYKREDVIGRFGYDVLKTRLAEGVEGYREKLLTEGTWSGEAAQTTISGDVVLVDSRAQVIELDGRKVVLQTSRDVTEMRRAEAALRDSELRYRQLFENNPYPMWVYDTEDLRILAVNDAAVQHYGYTADEFRSMTISDIRPAEDYGALIETARTNRPYAEQTGRWRHIKKDGTIINVQVNSHPLDFEGKKARLVLANDVTDRLRAERALRESEAKYRELVANANDIIYTHDLEGRFTSLNHTGERVTGYTEEEAKRLSIADIVAPDFMPQAREMIEKKLASHGTTIYETELIAKDGRSIPIEVNSRLIYEDGRPVAVQGIARDFTERRKTEEELRQQRERLDKTAEAAPVVICSLRSGPDGIRNFPFASPASITVFGFTPEQLERSADPVFERIEPSYLPMIEEARKSGLREPSTVHITFEYDHPFRGRVWIEVYATPTLDKDGSLTWHGIAADISEQKSAEQALLASEEQLRQAQKLESIGILAGGLAHDFNNMLTAINGYSELILRRVGHDDPIRRHVEEIRRAGERSAELTRQLLAFGRRQILQPTTLDLNGVIADTTSMLRRLIGENVTITTDLAPDLWKVNADQGQLTQVLMNLVINARDAMPGGGIVSIETENVEFGDDRALRYPNMKPGRYAMLAISDHGIGMDEQTRGRVFEPFFTTKPVGHGTGLGLSTVYGIVKQSGGNIWVYSEPGKGSTFKIYLPQAAGSEDDVRRGGEPRQLRAGSEKVLLVEDEDSVRGLARQILESCGYRVVEAANGAEVFAKFQRECEEIDLLITDIVMPEMGGRELSEKITTRWPHMKVLFTSGYTDDAIARHGIIDEGKNFLQKPFTFDGLARKVRHVLDESRADQ